MKESLYTIPVNEGFEAGGECPFCNIYHKLETESVDFMLGASYMEDDIRMETNKTGFCSKHYLMMYQKQNRLGVALMADTHLQKVIEDIKSLGEELKNEKKPFFAKNNNKNALSAYLDNVTEDCYICNKINKNFERYIDTFFFMWKKDNDMKEKVKSSNGFCLKHFSKLTDVGKKKLSAAAFAEFIDIILPKEIENLQRLEGELGFFINKFDHRYKDEPWGSAKDALIRALLKIGSVKVEQE